MMATLADLCGRKESRAIGKYNGSLSIAKDEDKREGMQHFIRQSLKQLISLSYEKHRPISYRSRRPFLQCCN
jgi:hypothetical protein